jgi:hypothetical protein
MYTESKNATSTNNHGRYVYLNKFNNHKDETNTRIEHLEAKMINIQNQCKQLKRELYVFTIILAVTLSFVTLFAFVK